MNINRQLKSTGILYWSCDLFTRKVKPLIMNMTKNSNDKIILPFSGSIPSLMAGLAFGSLMGYGTYQTSNDPQNVNLSLGASSSNLVQTLDDMFKFYGF